MKTAERLIRDHHKKNSCKKQKPANNGSIIKWSDPNFNQLMPLMELTSFCRGFFGIKMDGWLDIDQERQESVW